MANIHTPIPSLKLNDGNSIPMLAYGTGTAHYKQAGSSGIDPDLVAVIKMAISLGYYHLDGAEVYNNEAELGLAIKESGVARDKLFVTTKVMNGVTDIPAALETSLKKLQLDYVDLYLIHSPFFAHEQPDYHSALDKTKLQSAWKTMEQLQQSGKVRSIGVSNYTPKHLAALLETAVKPPAINQIEFHHYLQHAELLALHKAHGIATAAYGPLTAVTKAAPGPADGELAALAKKYAVSPGEICLRWCIDQDVVAVTTSAKEQRLSDYLRAMRFKLTPSEVQRLNDVGREKHFRGFFKKQFADDERI